MGRIYWLTQRSLDDLCSTTIEYLLDGVASMGFDLIAIGPSPMIQNREWQHKVVNRTKVRGFRTSSLAKNIIKELANHIVSPRDIIIIDWPLVSKLYKYLQSIGCYWIMIDRSPPADAGVFGKLQWRSWRNAWKRVLNSEKARGCVVSKSHATMVNQHLGVPINEQTVLPAGVDLDLFTKSDKGQGGCLSLVYHGSIDKNRGIQSLPVIHKRLGEKGIKSKLTIIGDGDYVDALTAKYSRVEDISIRKSISRKEVGELLSNSDVGLLPMPDGGVWNIASPLKLSEYLASGMVVCGIDHSGHRLTDSMEWLQLFEDSEFIEKSTEWIANLNQERLLQYQNHARKYAESYLSWSRSVEVLGKLIMSLS